jgi:hypothetical protein
MSVQHSHNNACNKTPIIKVFVVLRWRENRFVVKVEQTIPESLLRPHFSGHVTCSLSTPIHLLHVVHREHFDGYLETAVESDLLPASKASFEKTHSLVHNVVDVVIEERISTRSDI